MCSKTIGSLLKIYLYTENCMEVRFFYGDKFEIMHDVYE